MKISELPALEHFTVGDLIPAVRDSITSAVGNNDNFMFLYSAETPALEISNDTNKVLITSPDQNTYIEVSNGQVEISPTASGVFYMQGPAISGNSTPTGLNDAMGVAGSLSWDDDYFYVKTSGGWARVALTLMAP